MVEEPALRADAAPAGEEGPPSHQTEDRADTTGSSADPPLGSWLDLLVYVLVIVGLVLLLVVVWLLIACRDGVGCISH